MKIFILIFLILSSLSGSLNINNIEFDKLYYSQDLSSGDLVYCRMPIISIDMMAILVMTSKSYFDHFKVSVSFFYEEPSESEIKDALWTNIDYSIIEGNDVVNFTYPMKMQSGSRYLAVKFEITKSTYLIIFSVVPYKLPVYNLELDAIYSLNFEIHSGNSIYLKIPLDNNDNIQLFLQTYYNYINYFSISVKCFDGNPSDKTIVDANWNKKLSYGKNELIEGELISYLCPIDIIKDSTFLGVQIYSINNINFLDLKITPYYDYTWVYIVVGILCVIILSISVFLVRKYFFRRKKNFLSYNYELY